jgi:hypothetical protein
MKVGLEFIKKLLANTLTAFGTIALVCGVLDILWPNKLNYGWKGLVAYCILSIVYGLIRSLPKQEISRVFSTPDMKVTIRIEDIFHSSSHLVIGMNDVFDTEVGEIICSSSLQAQFMSKIYGNNQSRLDQDLEAALVKYSGKIDRQKTEGKNKRYPIGQLRYSRDKEIKNISVVPIAS